MKVTSVNIRDLSTSSSEGLSIKFRCEEAHCLSAPFEFSPITLLIFCAPRNHLWRSTHFDSANLPTGWKDDLRRVLVENESLTRELKKLRLSKKSLPLGLLDIDQEEKYCHGRFDWESLWFQSVLLPNELVPVLLDYVDQWNSQLGMLAFIPCLDQVWLKSSEDLIRSTRSGFLRTVNEFNIVDDWAGSDGLLMQLMNLIEKLEAGVQVSKLLPWSFLAFESDPIDIDRSLILRPRGRKNITKDFMPESFQVTKGVLDTIFSLRARLLRLSALPQFYRAAKLHLARGRESMIAHPFSEGIPFDPILELELYIVELLQKYPILDVDPYPPSAFVMSA